MAGSPIQSRATKRIPTDVDGVDRRVSRQRMSYFDKFGEKDPDRERDFEAKTPDHPELRAFLRNGDQKWQLHSGDKCTEWIEFEPEDVVDTEANR